MPSAGELLREQRLKRNRSLSDIANQTCICSRYLQAIETDRTEELPGDFFYRSFIRQYASALDLDEGTTSQIMASVRSVPEPDLLPALSEAWEKPPEPSSGFRAPTGLAITLFVAVLIGCSGLYAWWQKSQTESENSTALPESASASVEHPPAQTAAAPEPTSDPSADTPAAGPSSADPSTAAQPAAASPAAAEGTQPAETAAAEVGKTSVDLSASEQTWVSLSSEGKTIFSGLLDAAQSRNFFIGERGRLLTGNAGGLDVKVNGRPIGPIGPRGQVRVVVIAGQDVRIVSPPPATAPAKNM